ncbi:MAG: hypothetical protein ACTS4W_00435 [Candidatus Hodgkinia cicadicola]
MILKNIVAIVLSYSNFKIIDFGIMVHSQRIVKTAKMLKSVSLDLRD